MTTTDTALLGDDVTAAADQYARPTTWRDLVWLTWRQHRAMVIATVLITIATSATLLTFAAMLHHYGSCLGTDSCYSDYRVTASNLADILRALVFLPALVGALWGAPLLAREIESNTLGLALGQDLSLRRWFIGKTAALSVVLVVSALAVSASTLVAVWTTNSASNNFSGDAFDTKIFETGIPVFTGYVVLAFALGVALGAVLANTLTALALAGAGFLGIWHGLRTVRSSYVSPDSTLRNHAAWTAQFNECGICLGVAGVLFLIAYAVVHNRANT